MGTTQADIIARLQQDILLLQGFKPASLRAVNNGGLSLIKEAFPNNCFPLGAIHEYVCSNPAEAAASAGFISAIVSSMITETGLLVWIGTKNTVFPHGLTMFGISPANVLFVDTSNEKEKLWVIKEALKCEALTAVIADIKEIGFTESRKFQLAVEQTGVTCFLLRQNIKNTASCCHTRWQVKPVFEPGNEIPGVGFTQWNVELQKVKNGKPGTWQLEWRAGRFKHVAKPQTQPVQLPLRKVG
jgi:protein ImuA